jgi:hypothetical protein
MKNLIDYYESILDEPDFDKTADELLKFRKVVLNNIDNFMNFITKEILKKDHWVINYVGINKNNGEVFDIDPKKCFEYHLSRDESESFVSLNYLKDVNTKIKKYLHDNKLENFFKLDFYNTGEGFVVSVYLSEICDPINRTECLFGLCSSKDPSIKTNIEIWSRNKLKL